MSSRILKIGFAALLVVLVAGWVAYSTTGATPLVSADKVACECNCGCLTSGVCKCGEKDAGCPCKCGCGKSGICNCAKKTAACDCGKKTAACGSNCEKGKAANCCPMSQ